LLAKSDVGLAYSALASGSYSYTVIPCRTVTRSSITVHYISTIATFILLYPWSQNLSLISLRSILSKVYRLREVESVGVRIGVSDIHYATTISKSCQNQAGRHVAQ
jgi:hypothetical protein